MRHRDVQDLKGLNNLVENSVAIRYFAKSLENKILEEVAEVEEEVEKEEEVEEKTQRVEDVSGQSNSYRSDKLISENRWYPTKVHYHSSNIIEL
jgi:hypothetical protein